MKRKKHRIRRLITRAAACIVIYVLAGALLPYVSHRTAGIDDMQQGLTYAGEHGSAERVMCIDDNVDALVWRLRLIESAKEEIVLSTFDFMTDESGSDIISALCCAADRDVKVRIIIDGMTAAIHLKGKDAYEAMISHPNITVRLYNPINLLTPWTLNARLHDKYLLVDQREYILGGRNLYNLFLGDYSESKNVDRDLLIHVPENAQDGSSAQALHAYFEEMWAQTCAKQEKGKETEQTRLQLTALRSHFASLSEQMKREGYSLSEYDINELTFPVNQISFAANPKEAENKAPTLWETLCACMKQGSSIVIQTPYIVCSKQMYADLTEAAENAESIEVYTNAVESGANPWGCIDYLNEKEDILDTGVTIYEVLGEHSLHKKTILIDDNISIVGSYNLDMRSTYMDTEIMLIIDCPQLNAQLRAQVSEDSACSRCICPDGSVSYGEAYEERSLAESKERAYAVMRFVLRPFRFLL